MANQQRGRWGPVASLLIVAALVGSALLAAPHRALAAETVLSSGVADASGAQGPKWRRVDFTVPVSGQSTLRLSWTGTADMRFTVFNAATGQKLGENLTGANPKSVTLNLSKFLHWLDLSVEAPHFDRWTYFKGGYENVYMNFDGTVRRSQGYSTTIVFDRAIEYVNDFEGRDDARPFYLHLAPIAPHDPSIAEPRYAGATVPAHQPDPSYLEADRADKPPFVRNQNPTAVAVQATRTAMIRTLYSSTTRSTG